jgi:hypothetical protein
MGWTDDWSLSQKLGYKSIATKAVCYHDNPMNLQEIYDQARWIGKNQFITGTLFKKTLNLIRYCVFVSIIIGIYKSIKYQVWHFLLFKLAYDFGIVTGIILSINKKDYSK